MRLPSQKKRRSAPQGLPGLEPDEQALLDLLPASEALAKTDAKAS